MATSKDFKVKHGLVVGDDILLGGVFKDLSGQIIPLGGTSSDTYAIKDYLSLQQSNTAIGTVTAKSTIPATSVFTDYVGTQTGNTTTEELYSVLNFNYAYFYNSYADIYSDVAGNDKVKELFAVGNTVRITKNGYWWDLQITSIGSSSNQTYWNPQYTVTGTNSPWTYPADYQAYYHWNQNISFSTNLPVAQKYVLTLNAPAVALGSSDKVLFNGSKIGTPYNLSITSVGTWDVSYTSGATGYDVVFGSNTQYANQDQFRELCTVGTTVTITDSNNWGSGVYTVTEVGTDNVWNTAKGVRIKFQYVSGIDYPQTYASLAQVLWSMISSVSGTVTPNYTTKYRATNFSTLDNTSYVSFSNYDFINIGDIVSYIPGTTSIQFKDDAGNNIKAISYNNSTGGITYEGIDQTIIIGNNNVYSSNVDPATPVTVQSNSVAIGKNSKFTGNQAVAIGYNCTTTDSGTAVGPHSHVDSVYGTAIGYGAAASTFGTAVGYYSTANSGVAVGDNASTGNGIAIRGNASGSRSINFGAYTNASHNCQFKYSTSESYQYINETSSVFWSAGNLTGSGAKYLYATNGADGSTQTSQTSSTNFALDIGSRFSKYRRMMLYGTATVMIKPTLDSNVDDAKVVEIKMVIRSTADYTYVLEILSTNNVFAGTGSLHPNWTPSFELYQNRHLLFKMDKGSDTTAIGILCKVDFQVLHTA